MSLTLVIAVILAPAWAYLVGTAVAAVRFARRATPSGAERPPVSLLKPLHGAEPGLYENLRSFAEQDYPVVQVVLGLNDANDSAWPVAQALIRDLPASDIALVRDPPVRGSNLKVANLENMLTAARHDILVISDSDMRVDRRCHRAAARSPHRPRHLPLRGRFDWGLLVRARCVAHQFRLSSQRAGGRGRGHRPWLLRCDDRVAARDPRAHRRVPATARRARRRPPDRGRGARARPRGRAVALCRRGPGIRAVLRQPVASRAALGADRARDRSGGLCRLGAEPSGGASRARRRGQPIWLDLRYPSGDFLPAEMGHGGGDRGRPQLHDRRGLAAPGA